MTNYYYKIIYNIPGCSHYFNQHKFILCNPYTNEVIKCGNLKTCYYIMQKYFHYSEEELNKALIDGRIVFFKTAED